MPIRPTTTIPGSSGRGGGRGTPNKKGRRFGQPLLATGGEDSPPSATLRCLGRHNDQRGGLDVGAFDLVALLDVGQHGRILDLQLDDAALGAEHGDAAALGIDFHDVGDEGNFARLHGARFLARLGSLQVAAFDRLAQAATLLQLDRQGFKVLGNHAIANLDLGQVLDGLADDDVEDIAFGALERHGTGLEIDRQHFGFDLDRVADHGARRRRCSSGGRGIGGEGRAEDEAHGKQCGIYSMFHGYCSCR
ncbi:MAG: hypothetical protein HT580_00190 [Dechloromonas sp.]|nr:MAG: hypothetical protein HT580_00190 [Dechloromonas sp.]